MALLLEDSIRVLAQACPALASLTYAGIMSPALLGAFGLACPLLTALTINNFPEELLYLQLVVQQLPTFLPHLNSLAIPDLHEELLDMSDCSNILTLDIGSYTFYPDAHWRFLPPKLQHLLCEGVSAGPPPASAGSGPLLTSLLTLELMEQSMTLDTLAQLLRAAGTLRGIKAGGHLEPGYTGWFIGCPFSLSTAADLALLHARMDEGLSVVVKYHIGRGLRTIEGSLQPFIDALPCMQRVTTCAFTRVQPAEFRPLFQAFPSLKHMQLFSQPVMDDVLLQEVAACSHLTKLVLWDCGHVSPMGLLALCLRLPSLELITYDVCALLIEPFVQNCVKLLESQGVSVRIVQSY